MYTAFLTWCPGRQRWRLRDLMGPYPSSKANARRKRKYHNVCKMFVKLPLAIVNGLPNRKRATVGKLLADLQRKNLEFVNGRN